MEPKLLLLLSESQIKDKTYKEVFGYYDYDENHIIINLKKHAEISDDEDELIKNLCDTISHEYLHHAIWECRKHLGKKLRYDFFEEWIIAEALGSKFDQEEYYYLIQEE